MADKKLTDEEIIKALEDYIKDNEFEYFHSNMMGEYPLIRKSLDTIIRKTEEIESLKAELSNARRKALLEASSKFAGHSNYHGDTIICKLICMAEGQEVGTAIPLEMSEMKAEAYKRFAKKLEEKLCDCRTVSDGEYCGFDCGDIHQTITNLLKEMVGDE